MTHFSRGIIAADVPPIVERIASSVLRPGIDQAFELGHLNPAALPALARSGLLGLSLPPRYGGLGGDYLALGAAAESLASIDLSYQITLTVHLALTAMTILQWGKERQRSAWLPLLARGERIATFGLTEPGAGSDVAALQMRAVPAGSGHRLTGEKTWISGAGDAELFLLFATVDPTARHHGITAYIVPRETDGLSTVPLTGKLGVRAGDTGSVVCDGALVSNEQMLGRAGEGFAVALSALSNGLFTVGWGALGIAEESIRLSRELVHDLDGRGIAAGRDQWVQQAIAGMVSAAARARLLLQQAAHLKNGGLPNQQATSLAKWVAADAGFRAAASALTIHQSFVPSDHPTIERHLRNAKGAVIYGGTDQIHQTMQASYALGQRYERPYRRPAPTAAILRGELPPPP